MEGDYASYEGTGIQYENHLKQRFYIEDKSDINLEYCARLCMAGSKCDMFEYEPSSKKCGLAPHITLKDEPFHKVRIFTKMCTLSKFVRTNFVG